MQNLNEQKLINILTERFGDPIAETHAGPGVADERHLPVPKPKNQPREPKMKTRGWFDEPPGKWPGEK